MKKQIPRILGLLKLNNRYIEEVMDDKQATRMGVIILLVPVIALFLMQISFYGRFFSFKMISGNFAYMFSVILFVVIMNFIANNYFGGKGDMAKSFRAVAYSQILYWVPIIFGILLLILKTDLSFWIVWTHRLAMIWGIVVAYKVFQLEYKLKDQDAVVCTVLSVFGFYVVQFLLNKILMFPVS